MTYDQYWFGDVWMVRAFQKAEKLRQMRMDNEAWLTGIYVKNALEATVCNMFSGKNAKKMKYPDKPFMFEQEEEEKKKEKEQSNETAVAKLYMLQMVKAGKDWGNH